MVTIVPFTWPRREGVRQAGGRGVGTGRSHEHDSGDTHLDYPVPLLHPSSHGRPPCDREEKRGVTEGQRDSGRSQGLHSYRSHLILAHSLPWGGHGSHPAPISHGTRLETEEWVLPAQHPAHMQLKPLLRSLSQTASLGTVKGTPSCDDPPQDGSDSPRELPHAWTPGWERASGRSSPAQPLLPLLSARTKLPRLEHTKNSLFPKAKTKRKMFPSGSTPRQGPKTQQRAPRVESTSDCSDSFAFNGLIIGKRRERGEGRQAWTWGPRPCPPPYPGSPRVQGPTRWGDPQCRRHTPAPTCPWNWPRFPFPRLGSFFLALGAEAGGKGEEVGTSAVK